MYALEFEHDLKNEHDMQVECAAQLYTYAAGGLYQRCTDGYPGPLRPINMRDSKVRALWHDSNEDEGYSEKRWRFWKERWGVISTGGRTGFVRESSRSGEKGAAGHGGS